MYTGRSCLGSSVVSTLNGGKEGLEEYPQTMDWAGQVYLLRLIHVAGHC